MHIESSMYRDINIIDNDFNNDDMTLKTIPIYNLYLNEKNYKNSLLEILEKTNG